jgi:nicotinate-nucleotide adenylyltransferase
MKTIALFGGSFDPPHVGHEAVINALEKLDYIDKIIVMPTFLNPFKSKSHAPSVLRLEWLKCIFANHKNVLIDSYEVREKKKVPTIESVTYLLEKYQKVFVVIGADNLATLKRWHRYDELKDKVSFIVAWREKTEIPQEFIQIKVDVDISSSTLRKVMDETKLTTKCAQEIAQFYKETDAK